MKLVCPNGCKLGDSKWKFQAMSLLYFDENAKIFLDDVEPEYWITRKDLLYENRELEERNIICIACNEVATIIEE